MPEPYEPWFDTFSTSFGAVVKEAGLALRQVESKDRNWGLFITQLITSYSRASMRYVNLNWQQILHNYISEHQSGPNICHGI